MEKTECNHKFITIGRLNNAPKVLQCIKCGKTINPKTNGNK